MNEGDKDTPICAAAKQECVIEVQKQVIKEAFLDSLKDDDSAKKGCNCLPACTSINYDVELSPSKYNLAEFNRRLMPSCDFSM